MLLVDDPVAADITSVVAIGRDADGHLHVGLQNNWYTIVVRRDGAVEFRRGEFVHVVRPGTWVCTCRDYQYRKHRCKHVLGLDALMEMTRVLDGEGAEAKGG